MGEVKSNMKPTTVKKDGIFAKVQKAISGKSKPKKNADERLADQLETTFGDVLDLLQTPSYPKAIKLDVSMKDMSDTLYTLTAIKEGDLTAEKGKETKNHKKLWHLRCMRFHVDRNQELTSSYVKDSKKEILHSSYVWDSKKEILHTIQYHLEGIANEAVEYEDA